MYNYIVVFVHTNLRVILYNATFYNGCGSVMLEKENQEADELVELLERCSDKDKAAFRSLYERTSRYLNTVAFRVLRDREACKDVLQEAFVQIWNNASGYQAQKSKPLTWLSSIVRYRALDRLDKDRRLSANICYGESFEKILGLGVFENCPEECVNALQVQKQLKAGMETLSGDMRRSVELAYLHGLTRNEIAEKLATNSNTIKSWIRRGGKKLKLSLMTNR